MSRQLRPLAPLSSQGESAQSNATAVMAPCSPTASHPSHFVGPTDFSSGDVRAVWQQYCLNNTPNSNLSVYFAHRMTQGLGGRIMLNIPSRAAISAGEDGTTTIIEPQFDIRDPSQQSNLLRFSSTLYDTDVAHTWSGESVSVGEQQRLPLGMYPVTLNNAIMRELDRASSGQINGQGILSGIFGAAYRRGDGMYISSMITNQNDNPSNIIYTLQSQPSTPGLPPFATVRHYDMSEDGALRPIKSQGIRAVGTGLGSAAGCVVDSAELEDSVWGTAPGP
ncbi:uncharacterized protein I303_100421 [Kwoniella dejecticola CBS 10117]|uniref:Uncharacterized protein n=1 Tax=Kwoniella dejecticola CBS 10117 TaxID=1296121 RepID=A0A1A6AEX8_9TREE|nr:uncharacterized protein I303_00421 [Kwoniella dejecticola CBS 10117]OBR88604.1 hypothetical protein I303_00421 [Kwoniella dejecticola CBS 10117]